MTMDLTGVLFSAFGVFIAGHAIAFFIKQGEFNQWKKDVEEKLEDMGAAVAKMNEIHNLEQLNAQKLNQVATDMKEHKQTTVGQFRDLGNKIDGMVSEVIKTLGKLAEK